MSIRGRVGRHATTGRHCQNWKDDQQVVIRLLNAIAADRGGAAGALNGRIVAGIAGDGLYQAILRFQQQHFPARRIGFIDPGGPMLALLEKLAAPAPAPPPAPKRPGQWDGLATKSVRTALTRALDDDMRVSHSEAVNIIRSTLSDGVVTDEEIKDLDAVSAKSKSLSSTSRRMLDMLVAKLRKSAASRGPYELMLEKHRFAADMACGFLERSGSTSFPWLDRMDVGTGLLMRIANPGLFNQDRAGLCGPASFLFNVVYDSPGIYARFVIDLFEKGEASIRNLKVSPGSDLRNYRPPESIDHVDWMTMASLRDSTNLLFDYESIGDNGGTTAKEMAKWLRSAGYEDVRENTTKAHSGPATIDELNSLFSQGYRISLFINANMLSEDKQSTIAGVNHFVVLRSAIVRAGGMVRLKVFTWGKGHYDVPHGATPLPESDFLGNLYGYVAAKPY